MPYPEYENDEGVYTAGVIYTDGCLKVIFAGGHLCFDAAKARAIRLRDALRAAGELGVAAHVGFSGERLPGFPRGGVSVGR